MRAKALILTLAIVVVGCVNWPPPPEIIGKKYDAQRLETARVALVADMVPPEIEGVHLGLTRGEGVVAGAASGALLPIAATAPAGPYALVAGVLLMPVFAIGGAIAGATSGYSADLLREAEANAQQLLDSGYLQESLLERVRNYGYGNAELEFFRLPDADQGAFAVPPHSIDSSFKTTDFILEIKLLKVVLKGSLEIDARARLLSVDTGAILNDSQYQFFSVRHKLTEWMADGAAPLIKTIEYGLQTLAEDIVNENFLLFYSSTPQDRLRPQNGTPVETADTKPLVSVPYYVLAPISPELVSCFFCREDTWNLQKFVEVESIQPTLRWQSFPRDYDLVHMGRDISHVVYDLRIFRTAETTANQGPNQRTFLAPDTPIYSFRDIAEPEHKIAVPLEECTGYMWTVRARFRLDQQVRVTEWAGTFNWPPWVMRRFKEPEPFLYEPVRPEWYYFPFKTPCNKAHN